MNFLSGMFLFGAVAAAGPVLIHLLNRRRYRTVQWAAMDFLREALKRNKKIIEVRDILLMILRTLAILFFIFAMARPYVVSTDARTSARQPVHAVVVLDNSLSMGFKQLGRTLLDVAKDRAREYIAALPDGSHISVIPLASAETWHTRDVYTNTEDAWEALDEIRVVDRLGRASVGAETAAQAARQASPIPSKRVVFFSDLQSRSWASRELGDYFAPLKGAQVVRVIDEQRSNAWIERFTLRDGVADAQTEAVFLATVRYEGDQPRESVAVQLRIDGELVDSQTVDLQPGQALDLRFKHAFDVAGTSQQPRFVVATLQLPPDHLEEDDRRSLIVPVVASVPVVFIDQYGPREDPRLDVYGETFPLRRLLAPRTRADVDQKRLVRVVHRTIDEVTREDLAQARLVAMAGVAEPTDALVQMLREYVQQGGQLFLAAGASFDPFQWTQIAWQEGAGILPLPLAPEPIGKTPIEDPDATPFALAPDTMTDELFYLALTEPQRDALLSLPIIYKAVAAEEGATDELREAEMQRIADRVEWLDQYLDNEQTWAQQEAAAALSADEAAKREAGRRRFEQLNPNWLQWSLGEEQEKALDIEQRVDRTMPRVMGRYTNGEPFAVKRRIGAGRIVFFTTGVFPVWNNIATDNAVLLFDQVLREMLAASLPDRTLQMPRELVIPVEPKDVGADFLVHVPGEEDPITFRPKALDEFTYGFVIRDVARRGVYTVQRQVMPGESDENAWSLSLAVAGSPQESDLKSVDEQRLREQMGEADVRLVGVGEPVKLEGTTVLGYDMWRWLLYLAVACLAAEMIFLAAPRLLGERTQT